MRHHQVVKFRDGQSSTVAATLIATVVAIGVAACTTQTQTATSTIAGDWDEYLAAGATTRPGFEGGRRGGFAHFTARDSGAVGAIRRRPGEPMLEVKRVR